MQIEGRNPVLELLKSEHKVSKLVLQSQINQDTKINAIQKKAKKLGIKILRASKKELDKMSKTNAHQGVIAFAKHENMTSLDELIDEKMSAGEQLKMVYIRDAHHEHNIGAIIRTAECAGFDAVILPPKLNVTPQIARGSMGASEHITIYSESLFPLMKKLRDTGISMFGIERTDQAKQYTKVDMTNHLMLLIGGEDHELSQEIIDRCDDCVIIPQFGKVNSLNMSVAASLVIYEVVRQNDKKN